MTAYEIPLAATDQRFAIPLNGVTYQLTCKWCDPAAAWTLDIATDGGEALVSGIPIVTGIDLLEQHRHLGIAGQLMAQTDGDTWAPPTQTNLGVAGRLYFIPDEAATSTAAGAVFETPVTPGFNALGALAALAPDAGAIIVGTGATWITETGATARTSLGVGTGDSPQFTGVELGHASDTTLTRVSAGDIAIEGNTVHRVGGVDVAVADGGTGASTAAGARTNLGIASTVGQISAFVGTTAPTGWLKANGALVSRTTYAALWTYAQACGSLATDATWASSKLYGDFSMGDGSTTFRLPDLRQCFPMGWADNKTGGVDDGRTIGSFQDQGVLSHTHTGTTGGQSENHTHQQTGTSAQLGSSATSWVMAATGSLSTSSASNDHTHSITTNATGGTRNVPNNVALMYCVSYL